MVKELSKFDVLVNELECQLLGKEEQLLLLAGTGNGISLLGSNNCSCSGNNCECTNNCQCDGNNCPCNSNNCHCGIQYPPPPDTNHSGTICNN